METRFHCGHLGGLLGGDFGSFGSGELVFCSGELVVIAGTAGASCRSEGASSLVIVARRITFFSRIPMLPADPLWLPVLLRPM